jgi:hypothetical protein
MQKLWSFQVRPSKSGFLRGVAARVFVMEQQRMDGSMKWWMKHAKPATKLDLGHKLNTMDSETKLCKD